jgi:hypothetical protein
VCFAGAQDRGDHLLAARRPAAEAGGTAPEPEHDDPVRGVEDRIEGCG